MAPMTRTRTTDRARHELLQRLLGLQGTALRNRKQLLRDSQPSGGIDLEESCVESEEQGLGFSLLQLTSQTVKGIETAIQRLQAGEFGTCSECQGPIGEARLKALPFAALCLGCQERADLVAAATGSLATDGWKSASR
jgi:DnaK suppressor protein